MKKYFYHILALLLLLTMGCKDDVQISSSDIDAPDLEGELIGFTSMLKTSKAITRAPFNSEEEMQKELYINSSTKRYTPVRNVSDQYNYTYSISMYKQGDGTPVGTAVYQLAQENNAGVVSDVTDGTLAPIFGQTSKLYWPDNVNKYAFKVSTVEQDENGQFVPTGFYKDQSTGSLFWANDEQKGYAFEPIWANETSDDLDGLNYRTSKDWYLATKQVLGENKPKDDYKKVPLYLKHQKAWITVKLKAGKGIPREYLYPVHTINDNSLSASIFSYPTYATDDNFITPWPVGSTIDYEVADTNGPEQSGVETTELHAIVEPHSYLADPTQNIISLKLNGMTFRYSANKDVNYSSYAEIIKDKSSSSLTAEELAGLSSDQRSAYDAMQSYNLQAGQHLTITATLTTDKVILITALLEDWDEVSMSSICDDYGKNGDPIIINNLLELEAFLDGTDNKAGNTAVIAAPNLTLGDNWTQRDLNCTLNLGGATIHSNGQFLKDITEKGSLINGTVNIVGDGDMTAALCTNNFGNIEQVDVTVDEDMRLLAYATQGGLAGINYGYIINCKSDLQVKGSSGYIGGIAGESKQKKGSNVLPVIDKCEVNARVGADDYNTPISGAGGIVGYAENRVSRCSFNYGMTLMQQTNQTIPYKNIVAATAGVNAEGKTPVNAYYNSWPTTAVNKIGSHDTQNANINTRAFYEAVIDCEAELKELVTKYTANRVYRIADDFTVSDSWEYGKETDGVVDNTSGGSTSTSAGDDGHELGKAYNLNFELDGNGKTITTTGKMLFTNINGYFHDFTVYCSESLVTNSSTQSTDAIAPLAFSVNGANAKLENIKIKMDRGKQDEQGEQTEPGKQIIASMPAGMVVWAYGGAVIKNCEVQVDIQVRFADGFSNQDSQRFAGAIAACAVDATFSGCKVHTGTIIRQAVLPEGFYRTKQYRGGIVGGILNKADYTPGTILVDCYSWWKAPSKLDSDYKETDSPAGSLVGATKYVIGNQSQNGIKSSDCSGNWWQGNAAADLATEADAMKILGKKNGVNPVEVQDF